MKKKLFILFVVALILRILFVFFTDNEHLGAWGDEGYKIAQSIVEGRGYQMWVGIGELKSPRPPVFPLFLAVVFLVFGQSIIIVKIVLAFLGSLLCLAVFLLARELFNERVGLTAMIICVFYPAFIYWCGFLTHEMITSVLLVLVTLFVLRIRKRPFLYSMLSGLFLGALIMTRSMAYGLLPLIFAWIVVFIKDKKAVLTFLFFSLLVLAPWVVRNYVVHNRLLLASTEGGMTFYAANNPDTFSKGGGDFYVLGVSPEEVSGLSEVDADKFYYRKGLSFIKSNPLAYARLVGGRFIRFWRFYPHITGFSDSYNYFHVFVSLLTETPIIIMGIFGWFLLYKKDKRAAVLLLAVVFNFNLVAMLIRSAIKYRVPIMAYLIILSAYFGQYLFDRRKELILEE